MVFLPMLSEYDPLASTEGTLDPLGLYAIADSLGWRLAPGIRERQKHPRFLTATAVSLAVCGAFDDEILAADQTSEPWLVFEWHLVEGLVRRPPEDGLTLNGLPGRDKATTAIQSCISLCARNYLKTPSVFGFHGVYRVLAQELGIMLKASRQLGEAGYELLTVWAAEQGLDGFVGTAMGDGRRWRQLLVDAISDGLKKGAVERSGGWAGWDFFARHLVHTQAGPREAGVIGRALMSMEGGFRYPLIDFLVSPEGWTIMQTFEPLLAERNLHKALANNCDSELKHLLETIMAYETFSRLLQDAFDDCLLRMSQVKGRVTMRELTELPAVREAAQELPEHYVELLEALEPYQESIRFQENFSSVSDRMSTEEWVSCLLDYHRRVQRRKPPAGKAPWFERFDDGSVIIRPGYLRESGGRHDDAYVHPYRAGSLMSFAKDLRMVD